MLWVVKGFGYFIIRGFVMVLKGCGYVMIFRGVVM